jgi:anti-sigma regulatory factor (Ser/Thr protein kinase)
MPEAQRAQLAEVKVPAQGDFIGPARTFTKSLGALRGFDFEKIDELAIAVTQACGDAIEQAEETWGQGATLRLSFAAIEGGIEVEVDSIAPRSHDALKGVPRTPPPEARQPGLAAAKARRAELEIQRAVAAEMIRLMVDDFRHQVDTGRRQVRYRMVKYLIR